MKIGILGAGNIGTTVARRLAAAGHEVRVANSREPETVPARALSSGAAAVHAHEVVQGAEVLITSIPYAKMADLKPLIDQLAPDAVVIDTANYYPHRDGVIAEVEAGQPESLWVNEQIGRSVVKAWNAIWTETFDAKNTEAGDPARIAIPVAGDDPDARAVAMSLVEQTGFDAYDAGLLADSWRQQPGSPVYCTEPTTDTIGAALAAADPARSPRRRDLSVRVLAEVMDDPTPVRGQDYIINLNRVLHT